jgi:hypothetical protein
VIFATALEQCLLGTRWFLQDPFDLWRGLRKPVFANSHGNRPRGTLRNGKPAPGLYGNRDIGQKLMG